MNIEFIKLDPNARAPRKAYTDDAGWDLFCVEDQAIEPNTPTDVRTGIAVAIPMGYYGRIVARSSAPRKRGIMVLEGIIDAGFRGELFACAFTWTLNYNDEISRVEVRQVKAGESIAQLLIQRVEPVYWTHVAELPDSDRGKRGFGSSG